MSCRSLLGTSALCALIAACSSPGADPDSRGDALFDYAPSVTRTFNENGDIVAEARFAYDEAQLLQTIVEKGQVSGGDDSVVTDHRYRFEYDSSARLKALHEDGIADDEVDKTESQFYERDESGDVIRIVLSEVDHGFDDSPDDALEAVVVKDPEGRRSRVEVSKNGSPFKLTEYTYHAESGLLETWSRADDVFFFTPDGIRTVVGDGLERRGVRTDVYNLSL
jgi:hypothetical protein